MPTDSQCQLLQAMSAMDLPADTYDIAGRRGRKGERIACKLSRMAAHGFVSLTETGWDITPKGREWVR